jgi:hypothetical protein
MPLYDTNRLISCLLTELRRPASTMLASLAPLFVLRVQLLALFVQREVLDCCFWNGNLTSD